MRIALHIFFRRIYFVNKHHIPKKGPVLLASTHPNSFLDDVLIANFSKRSIIFLARADIFSSKIAAFFLKQVHVYPIYRGRDNKGDVQKNLDSFEFYENYLAKIKMLLIHPEGICIHEKRVRPLKKGMGRIAFGAEEKNNWNLGIQIVPIGLNYTNAPYEREEIMVFCGEAIPAQNYQSVFEENPAKAFTKLKDDISTELKKLSIIQAKGTEEVSEKCLTLARNNLASNENGLISNPLHRFNQEKNTTDSVNRIYNLDSALFGELSQKITAYFSALEDNTLTDKMIKNPPRRWNSHFTWFKQSAELPFRIIGLLFHQIPYNFSLKLTQKLIKSIEFRASILLGLNFILFQLLYALIIIISSLLFGWWAILVTAIIGLGGLSLLDRKRKKKNSLAYHSYRKLKKDDPQIINNLLSLRENIWQIIVQ